VRARVCGYPFILNQVFLEVGQTVRNGAVPAAAPAVQNFRGGSLRQPALKAATSLAVWVGVRVQGQVSAYGAMSIRVGAWLV
jgi:hypothetical protein